jgi:hypothetical protein
MTAIARITIAATAAIIHFDDEGGAAVDCCIAAANLVDVDMREAPQCLQTVAFFKFA